MALKVKDGQVKFIMAAGNDDFVMSSMTEEEATKLIVVAKKKKRTDLFPEYPLCINDKYYLPEVDETEDAEEKPKKQKR